MSEKHRMVTEEYDNPLYRKGMKEIFSVYVIRTMRRFYDGDAWIDVLITAEEELDEGYDVHGSPGPVLYRISGCLPEDEEIDLLDRPTLDGARKIVRAFGCNS